MKTQLSLDAQCSRPSSTTSDTLRRLLESRHSSRSFLPTVVPRAQVERILDAAGLAPSWCNTQSWKVYYCAQAPLARLSAELLSAANDRDDIPDIEFVASYPPPYAARKHAADDALRSARGIGPGNVRGTVEAVRANLRFFGAPQALFLTVPRALGAYALLDLGCFLQSLLLGICADGLSACPQAALAQYPRAVRRHLPIPDDEAIVCGVSFGHADPDAPANHCRTARVELNEFVRTVDEG